MSNYYGDYLEDETVYIPFNTFDSNDPSASVTITNLADADIKVHKDGSATQIVTDGATIAIDFDSITGNHLITIDTSAHADYATGADYLVRIEGTTVDAATINAWVGSFSIENRAGARALRATTAGRTLDVSAGGEAGLDWANVGSPTTSVNLSGTTTNLVNTVTTYTGNTKQTADHTAGIADIPTVAEFNARTLVAASYFDPAVDAVANVTLVGTLTTYTGNTLQTADVATQVPNVLNTTALGNIGVDWANVENPTTALDLSATDIQLCDTITTYTGNTVQTADHTAGIADIPTVAEFNARTLVAASYFDPAADAVANVTLCATTTTNTDMRGTDSANTVVPDAAGTAATPADILTTALTESYAADGAAGTLSQILFGIQAFLQERSTATTTVTIKKLDGSTTAMTLTLDDATTPTSITRAT